MGRFFGLLGTVFGFVGSDVQQKLVQLECLRKGGAGEHYATVQQMMSWERESGLLESDKAGNGCRTLLRLHRALGQWVSTSRRRGALLIGGQEFTNLGLLRIEVSDAHGFSVSQMIVFCISLKKRDVVLYDSTGKVFYIV